MIHLQVIPIPIPYNYGNLNYQQLTLLSIPLLIAIGISIAGLISVLIDCWHGLIYWLIWIIIAIATALCAIPLFGTTITQSIIIGVAIIAVSFMMNIVDKRCRYW